MFELSDLRSPRVALRFVLGCLWIQLVVFVAIDLPIVLSWLALTCGVKLLNGFCGG